MGRMFLVNSDWFRRRRCSEQIVIGSNVDELDELVILPLKFCEIVYGHM